MDKLDIVNNKYKYDALVTSVYDGDTITVEINLGFKIKVRKKIRLYGIYTYELKGREMEKGLKAKKFTSDKVLNKIITLYTIKDRAGQFLGIIHYLDDDKYFNLNKELIINNHGKLFMI
tara:strand:- start:1120 stop:1476 length:357 start_codon:yes stop_codon:yes gene_type:complete